MDLGNLAMSHKRLVNHKSRKGQPGQLSQIAQVELRRDLCNKPPKLPRALASTRSKVRVTLFVEKDARECLFAEALTLQPNHKGPIPM
jgi:hypothetical protein